ncbi:ketopantoate reductase family protein [Halobacillus andaensis]|uniref:ketopantoate reductase family protein n=1 Tax=Halobacillus andaensis TaxID=1176239 RepID=UPI003D75A728
MKIGVVGGGAVGLLLSSYLSKIHEVSLFVRSEEQKQELNTSGITCEGLHGTVRAYTDAAYFNDQNLLLITVKQHHLPDILDQLPPSQPVVFLQNGMSHLSFIKELPNPLLVGVVEHGAVRHSGAEVQHTGKGIIYLADYQNSNKAQMITRCLSQGQFIFEYRKDYLKMMAGKLVINTVVNPITALFNVKNKEILSNSHLNNLAERLCWEACSTLQLSFNEQWSRVQEIAETTGENHSSMLQDILEGRRTEVDAICGYIVNRSGKEACYHSFVLNAIHALELKNQKGEAT